MLGQKIKKIRELKNFTQEYMAENLEISQPAYSKLEKGEIKVSDEKLIQIANILQMSPEDVAQFDDQKYFNSFNNNTNSNNNRNNTIDAENNSDFNVGNDGLQIKKLYEDKIELLEKLLSKTEAELEEYKAKFGAI